MSYSRTAYPVRSELTAAHRRAWGRLGAPGTWFSGAERAAIVAAARAADDCDLCRRRKDAVSPYAVDGEHDGADAAPAPLPAALVDVVHRIRTDPGRLSRRILDDALAAGVADAEYVEALSVLVTATDIDFFCRALGIAPHPLPTVVPGEPSGERPAGVADDGAWLPTLPNGDHPQSAALYGGNFYPNVGRAMSLVPDAVRALVDLFPAQYVPLTAVPDGTHEPDGRALNRAQMELVASRVSALNECFY